MDSQRQGRFIETVIYAFYWFSDGHMTSLDTLPSNWGQLGHGPVRIQKVYT